MIQNMKFVFIFLVFLLGLIFAMFYKRDDVIETFSLGTEHCPNLLMAEHGKFYLYNTKRAEVPGVNPIKFDTLDEYTEFMDWLRGRGIRCPVLYVQQVYDAQGNRTHRVLPDPLNPNFNMPLQPSEPKEKKISKLIDAGYTPDNIPGYDPDNQYIGLITPLDQMKEMTNKDGWSDSAFDSNWGGHSYTQQQIDSGKYRSMEVSRYTR